MPPLESPPKIKLSKLRDIGWSLWDPIGLLSPGQRWEDEDCLLFADEYDTYLLEAAGLLRRGAAESEIVDYLVRVEADGMDGQRPDMRDRAQAVVDAIQKDGELWIDPEA
jgi:hypothetical protein